uniref:Transposase n=1 Tax=Streptococcus suis TaxID=1307 RepID=G8DU23_STRSU|nr:transposase [Streptococcus suis]
MHSKHRAIKSFIIDFTTILLYQFPVAFQDLVFVGFAIELVHDLNANAVHSTAKVLHNVKAIKDDFGMRKKLFSQIGSMG